MADRPTLTELYERIKADMQTRVSSGVKIPRVSLLGVINLVFTGSINLAYGFLEWLQDQMFPDTASTFGLDRWANIWLEQPRKAPTYSTGVAAFTGTNFTAIPSGTEVSNDNGDVYATTALSAIGGGGSVQITCQATEAGTDSNMVISSENLTLVNPILNIDNAVTPTSGFDDATDEETDDDLIIRILQRIQNAPASGTCPDYVRWALSRDGVGKAWCFSAADWGGAGTVGVGVSDSNLEPVGSTILSTVEVYVDSVKPDPAAVDYFDVVDKVITYNISITPNTTAIQVAVEANLEEVFLADSDPGGTVLLTHMQQAIISGTAVDNYSITAMLEDGAPISIANIVQTGVNISRYGSTTFASL